MSDRVVRFPGQSWREIEALPQPLRWSVQRTIFHLLDEPVPALADSFPADDLLPGVRTAPPADGVTIWYTLTPSEGNEVISVQPARRGGDRGDHLVPVRLRTSGPGRRRHGLLQGARPHSFGPLPRPAPRWPTVDDLTVNRAS